MPSEPAPNPVSINSESSAPPSAKSESKVFSHVTFAARLDELLSNYPKGASALVDPSTFPLWEEKEFPRFIALIELILPHAEISDPSALIYVRDFAIAEMELERISCLRERVIENAIRSYLCAHFEGELRDNGHPEYQIKDEAISLTRQFIRDYKNRSELIARYHLLGLEKIKVEATRSRLGDLIKLDTRERHYWGRRDQALKMLEFIDKSAARRSREIARKRANQRAPNDDANAEPSPAQAA